MVPPDMANPMGVRYITGETPMPVVRPPCTTSQLACQRRAQTWKESVPMFSGVQMLS